VLIQVADAQGVSVFSYFSVNDASLKLTVDAYQTINALRPLGNRINLVRPLDNSTGKFGKFIRP